MAYARLRGAFSRHPLPPGELLNLDAAERSNRRFLLEQAQRLGPIFKAISGRRLVICLVGIPRCRELLKDHAEHLVPVTVNLESLFPKGFLRKMQGEEHRKYRQALVKAIDPELVSAHTTALQDIAGDGLKRFAATQTSANTDSRTYIRALDDIASGMLIHLFFGATVGSPAFDMLKNSYHKLGPEGFEWFIGREQRRHFMEIRNYLLEHLDHRVEGGSSWWSQSILHRMNANGALDETSLGQLIYMVEMGRFDLYSLFRWLTKHAANHPAIFEQIGLEDNRGATPGMNLAEAFVLETLRMDQSERLMRVASRDLIFEGYLIPRFASVRLCMWESHKSPENFKDPFNFDPQRFLAHGCIQDQYSPFGLDHHSCPLGDVVIQLSVIFIRTLARHYRLEAIGDGPAVRGRYHWQPARGFTVRLHKP